jgi:hypothetical protein
MTNQVGPHGFRPRGWRFWICEETIYLDDPILPHPDTPGPDDVVWVHASCAEEEK